MFRLLTALPLITVASIALAADVENKVEETKDTSHNPITGANTVTKKTSQKVKDGGHTYESKTRDRTKTKSDGSTETKSESKTTHEPD